MVARVDWKLHLLIDKFTIDTNNMLNLGLLLSSLISITLYTRTIYMQEMMFQKLWKNEKAKMLEKEKEKKEKHLKHLVDQAVRYNMMGE